MDQVRETRGERWRQQREGFHTDAETENLIEFVFVGRFVFHNQSGNEVKFMPTPVKVVSRSWEAVTGGINARHSLLQLIMMI